MKKRCTGLFLIECKMANPNGDPDQDGRPRTMNDGRGWIADVSIKSKLRSMFADHNTPIFKDIVENCKIDPERYYTWESFRCGTNYHAGEYTGKEVVKARDEARELAEKTPDAFLDKFFDIRLFGTTILEDNKAKKAGEKFQFKRSGTMTIQPAISIAPINILEATITKKVDVQKDNLEKLQCGMAPMAKKMVEHGLYTCRVCVSPNEGVETRTTEEDINVFKYVLKHLFSNSASASRPGGSINFVHAWWAEHENALGSFNEFTFWEKLTPKQKSEICRSLADYEIPTPDSVGLKMKVEDLAAW